MFEFLLATGGRLEFHPGAIAVEYLWKVPRNYRPGAIAVEYLYKQPATFHPGAVAVEYLYKTTT